MNLKTLHIFFATISATIFFAGCSTTVSSSQNITQEYIQDNESFHSYNTTYSDDISGDFKFKNSLSSSIDKYINTKAGGDCSGFILVLNKEHDSVFFNNKTINHFFTKGKGRSQAIFNYYNSRNKIAFQNPQVGDLIFFQNTTRSTKKSKHRNITHMGIVSEIFKDGRVRFVHNLKGKNQNGYMNLNKKNIFSSGDKTENSYIISCSHNQTSCLTSNKFAGYGKVAAQTKFQ